MGSIGQNSVFQNIVKLKIQFKGITKFNNIVANILPADPSPSLGDGVSRSKLNFFQIIVMLHIKLKRITNAENGHFRGHGSTLPRTNLTHFTWSTLGLNRHFYLKYFMRSLLASLRASHPENID